MKNKIIKIIVAYLILSTILGLYVVQIHIHNANYEIRQQVLDEITQAFFNMYYECIDKSLEGQRSESISYVIGDDLGKGGYEQLRFYCDDFIKAYSTNK